MMTQPRGGDLLGRYELLLPIAKGGMAEVWLARMQGTRGFRKIVAIKTILRGTMDDARMERMFIEEASIASQIHHPNTVGILDFGEHAGTLYIVMEWVEGEPLNAIVSEAGRHGGLPLAIAVNIVGQACKGLHAAHEQRDEDDRLLGIVHRDISPQNIMVSYSGTAKVLDFGIAKATSQVSALTELGEIKGKFAYMSPEQIAGAALDRRSDIFSLGVLAYMLTAGRHPFRGESSAETVRNISSTTPAKPPSAFNPDYPAALDSALLRALAKRPEDRYSNALEFLAALEHAGPQWHESSFELELATYMKELFGARQIERRRQLRLAEERSADSVGALLASTSNGSLGAVSIDRTGSNSSRSASSLSSGEVVELSASSAQKPAPVRRARWLLGVPLALSLVLVGVLLGRGLLTRRSAAPKSSAQLGNVDAGGAVEARTPQSLDVTARSLPPPPGFDDALPAASAVEPAARPTSRRRAPARAAAASASVSASSPIPVSSSSPTSATSISSAPPKPASSRPNSWDPSTFGGRY